MKTCKKKCKDKIVVAVGSNAWDGLTVSELMDVAKLDAEIKQHESKFRLLLVVIAFLCIMLAAALIYFIVSKNDAGVNTVVAFALGVLASSGRWARDERNTS